MNFDTWFNKQNIFLKVILLILPVVGWIVELLIRLSVALKHKDALHIIVLVLFIVIGWGWILVICDLIYMLVTGHLFLGE